MFKNLLLIIAYVITTHSLLKAQPTVGLKLNTADAYDGYVFFTPFYSDYTYLIDNCGEIINTWNSGARPYYTAYLMDNGSIVRLTGSASGNADYIEIRDWNDNLVWQWNPTGTDYDFMHSDLAIMPNGNLLVICEDRLTPTEWVTLGGDPNNISASFSAFEGVIEIQPVGTNNANVVWEWKLTDHIIQDFDATKANFGVVADHPELWNINNNNWVGLAADQQHFNGIDYHPTKDQIVFSCWTCSELLIIDHSTTTAQAAGNTGGNSAKGGDLLYRWGNPINYDHGTTADREFYGQHNTDWIEPSLPHGDKISLFENGNGRPGGAYTRAVILDPPTDAAGNYLADASGRYLPTSFDYQWSGNTYDGTAFYSQYMGGVNMQPNGNITICEAMTGRFFEVDPAGNVVWHYQNPDKATIYPQGTVPNSAWSYRAEKYQTSHPAFVGKDMSQKGTIEDFNTVTDNCTIYANCNITAAINGLPTVTSSNSPITLSGSPAGGTFSGAGVIFSAFNPSVAGPGIHQINYTYTDANGCSETATQNILVFTIVYNFVNYNLGTVAPKYSNTFDIQMQVKQTGNYTFELYNATGQQLMQQQTQLQTGHHTKTFQLNNALKKGVHFLKINDGKYQNVRKFNN